MTEEKSCKYCGWKFPLEYLNKITENSESLLCENCGTEILKGSDENAEDDNKIDVNNKKKGLLSRIYETIRNENNPIVRVLMDSDFPEKFKDNLKIVVSRLIFPHIRTFESESAQDIENMELTEEILNDLYEKISPIMNQRIKDILLINLNNISVKEFNKWLKFLQEKIELNQRYHKDFIIYLRWMISEVFIIISELWDATDIPKFERIIRDDLKFFETFINDSFPSQMIQREINHYNRWLTDKIQNYIKNMDKEIKFLFKPFKSFSKMDRLFGLGSNYICGQRMEKNNKKIIAVEFLDIMLISLKKNIQNWVINYPSLSDLLLKAQRDIIKFFNEYENKLSPKPSSRYQMYNHHPKFIRDYFKVIDTKEKAYWLGFLFADGWIGRELKDSGYYYRMGIGLSTKDKEVLFRFCKSVGLNLEYIEDRLSGSAFSNEKYPMSLIRWGDQEFAQHLINLGIKYIYNQEKGRRVKTPKLPILRDRELMLAFLLGFYDGDGTLGYNKFTNRIQPSLASSDKEFLLQIKNYFDIKNVISSRVIEKYNLRKNKMVKTHANALNIDVKLFEEMLKNYGNNMKRKKVELDFFDGYFEPKAKPPTPQRIWLRKKLPKDILKEIIKVLSPNKIAKLLGVHRSTIMNLIEEYSIYFFDGGHYLSIDRFIRYHGKEAELYEPFYRWSDYLKKIGKFSDQ